MNRSAFKFACFQGFLYIIIFIIVYIEASHSLAYVKSTCGCTAVENILLKLGFQGLPKGLISFSLLSLWKLLKEKA